MPKIAILTDNFFDMVDIRGDRGSDENSKKTIMGTNKKKNDKQISLNDIAGSLFGLEGEELNKELDDVCSFRQEHPRDLVDGERFLLLEESSIEHN